MSTFKYDVDIIQQITYTEYKRTLRIRKDLLKFYTKFLLPKCPNLDWSIMQRLNNMSIK